MVLCDKRAEIAFTIMVESYWNVLVMNYEIMT